MRTRNSILSPRGEVISLYCKGTKMYHSYLIVGIFSKQTTYYF